ncbi:class I SAM-dependent methyltransferase [Kribbella deserti]|uniref:Methyltransferase n=1 Tax=Kribbella deserti TaxID=1926257 RepID=A0ABV6QFM3_9ACTN
MRTEISLQAGDGTFHRLAADERPARVLALLERVGATRLSLPSGLLWQLCEEPAAPITDLAALRHISHHGPVPAPGAEARAAEVFGATIEHVPVAQTPLAEQMSAAAEAAVGPVDPDRVREFLTALDDAVLGSMLLTTDATDIDTAMSALNAPPRHRIVLERWLKALRENPGRSSDPQVVTAAWDRARAAWSGGLGSAAFVDYLRANADQLPALVSGEQQAALILFPEGRTDLADAVYRDTITARYLNTAVAAAVQALPRPLRVLEVGAGTGATTDAVIAAIGNAPTEYVFTDVSNFFLGIARERLGQHPWLRFGLFDIDQPAAGQPAVAAGGFDLIIAAGVLNNARNANDTVRELTGLLVPGGAMIITEPTREHYEILISQAFMMTETTDVRDSADEAMFLTREQWLDVLAGARAEVVAVLPAEDHALAPLGQRLFLARRHVS